MYECIYRCVKYSRSFDTAVWEVIYVGSYDVSISPPNLVDTEKLRNEERAGGEACGHLTLDEGCHRRTREVLPPPLS